MASTHLQILLNQSIYLPNTQGWSFIENFIEIKCDQSLFPIGSIDFF